MRYNTDHATKGASNDKFRIAMFVSLCLFLLFLITVFPGCIYYIPFSTPPDLSTCTRLEIQYDPSTLDYFVRCGDPQKLLTPAEKNYIQSLKTFVVDDQERIKAFAKDVSLGSYKAHIWWGGLSIGRAVYIDCYRNKKHVAFFGVFGDLIITKDRAWFRYPWGLPNLHIIEPPEILPFRLRDDCAGNLESLYVSGSALLLGKDFFGRDAKAYPEPTEWCDVIVRGFRNAYFIDDNGIRRRSYSEEEISRMFTCPSLRERVDLEHQRARPNESSSPKEPAPLLESHYAMNPNCGPNSPPDTVLLFETKAGWNQHGGPELFTFDNHDPGGGCVLLNDGTVKFIRTTEEFQQVRWK